MSTQVQNSFEMLHPILTDCCKRIQTQVIHAYNIPMKLFETGRTKERHQNLINKGRAQSILSRHLYNMEHNPPLYATAVVYVYYDGKWSWNLRDSTIQSWYQVFGNLVLDVCPELQWGMVNRKSSDYTYFQLREDVIVDNFDTFPCIMHP